MTTAELLEEISIELEMMGSTVQEAVARLICHFQSSERMKEGRVGAG